MIINRQSPKAIAQELGQRLKRARLNKNLSQEYVALHAGISRRAVARAEEGYVLLENMIEILVVLEMVEQLNLFLPAQHISPIQLLKLEGKKRRRASTRSKSEAGDKIKKEIDLGW